MATASKLTNDYLTCIICYEVYTDPATLQCDHTFCRPCLLKYIKTQPEAIQVKSIPCPVCMQMTRVTSPDKPVAEWVNQVKPSRIMRGLVEDFGRGKHNIDHCSVCKGGGETTPATVWCSDCEAAFCDNCAQYHRRMPNARGHDVQSFAADVNIKPSRRFMCWVHDDEQVKLFCRDCKKAICHTCCSISHRTCKTVVTIKEVLPDITSSLLTRKQNLDKKIKLTSNRITEGNSQIKTIEQKMTKAESEIKIASGKAVKFIREKEKKLMDELHGIRKAKVGKLKAGMKCDEMTRQVHQQQSQFIDQAVTSECQRDMFDMYERCESEQSPDSTESGNTGNKTSGTTGFYWDVDSLKKAFDEIQLGKLFDEQGREVGRHSHSVLVKTFDTKTDEDTKAPYIVDITVIKVNDTKVLVVADENNKSIKTFYTEDDEPRQSVLRLDKEPFGITSVGNNEIFITSPWSQKIYKVLVYPHAKCILTIATRGLYCGIHITNQQQLVVCNYIFFAASSVDLIDFKGNVLNSVQASVIKRPDFVWMSEDGTILVSDRESKSLIFITTDGKVTHTYTPTGDRALIQPQGITTTDTGDILLVDKDANKVIQLTSSGTFVRDILTMKDGLHKPHGLVLDEDGLLYVTSGRYIKVYTFK